MLRVTTIYASSAGASAQYYTAYLADDAVDDDGIWLGAEAEACGLAGIVSAEDLEALLSGHDPATGAQLGTALVDRVTADGKLVRAVAGYDMTFSAPKDVSVAMALTGDPRIRRAHDKAVRAVLEHLERYGSTTRVRVNGGRQHPETGGLIMAAFVQMTSREDDPQLHTHVVVSCKVRTRDGRWLALDARFLKQKQRALGGLYQSVLRAELTRALGVRWGDIENGQAGILGMPEDLTKAFSKRTEQVDDALAAKIVAFCEREGRNPSRYERAVMTRDAAKESRAKKSHQDSADLRQMWREEAAALGWTPDRLVGALTAAARTAPERERPTVGDVVDHLSATGSCWTRADVLRAVCDLVPPTSRFSGREWVDVIESMCDQVIDQCVSLDPAVAQGPIRQSDGRSIWLAPVEPSITHPGILAQEERIVGYAVDAIDAPSQPSTTVDREGLDVLQAEAAAAVAGDAPLVLVSGAAGAGKARILRYAADDLRRQNRRAFGVAPTAKAAKVLRDEARIPADTLAKLLHEWREGDPRDEFRLPPGTTVTLDEAGMVGTGALDDLVKLAKSQQWRLVLAGDHRQLQAVGRGGMFEELCRIGPTLELATVHRFHHRWEQAASLKLRAGSADAIDAYLDHGRVESGTFDQLVDDIAKRWIDHSAAGRSVAVLAETNAHVDALNDAIQRQRHGRGDLGGVLARIAGDEIAAVGDIVATRQNERHLRTDRDEPVRNRDRWRLVSIGQDGHLVVDHVDGHGRVTLPSDYVREHVRLGYAATTYGHQGDTVDVGLAMVTEATTHRALYVGATRGRDENRLFVVTDDPEGVRDILERALTNDRADIPAVVQRRNLAQQVPSGRGEQAGGETAEEAQLALEAAQRRAEPFLGPLIAATGDLRAAEAAEHAAMAALANAPRRHRPRLAKAAAAATESLEAARRIRGAAEQSAAPYLIELEVRTGNLQQAESRARALQALRRLGELAVESSSQSAGHESPSLGL